MKTLFILMSLFSLINAHAGTGTTIDDDFGSGSDEFEFERFNNESILSMIDQDMEMACNNQSGLCEIFSITQNESVFNVTFSLGEGNAASNIGKPDSSVIITDGSNGLFDPQEYWGVTLHYKKGRCTESINVPRSLYMSMNRYMYGLMDETGNTRRGLDPAKEAMIMFYTTIINQANGCDA